EKLKNFLARLGSAGAGSGLGVATRTVGFKGTSRTTSGPQISLVPQAAGRPFSMDYHDMLRGRSITLGRMENSDLVLNDTSVSRQHARISLVRGLGAAICDLGSVNGTFVDGQRISGRYVTLTGVTKIRLGECEIAVGLPDEAGKHRAAPQF